MHIQWENLPYPRSLSHHLIIQVQHKKENNSESNEKDEIWIELEDISPQKKKSTDKSYDITPKTKKPTATKKAKNENGEVTIQMYSNLKKAINNIDEDLNQCTLRYEEVKEVIAS